MKRRGQPAIPLFTRVVLGLGLLVGLSMLTGGLVRPVHAATTITVSVCDEAHLDGAISQANNDSGDTINFSCSGDITLTNTLGINQDMTLDGSGQAVTLDGQNAVEVLKVASVHFTLNALTITRGFSSGSGGGMYNNNGSVTISNSTFANNSVGQNGGGLYDFGGSSTISNSTFANNSAGGGGGGLISIASKVTISNSTFANNSGSVGGGLDNDSGGTVSISNSTFASNSGSIGGGLSNVGGTVSISNSTFASNSAAGNGHGGGVLNSCSCSMTIHSSTFTNNSGSTGGDLDNNFGTMTVDGSIVANSTSGGNCAGSITDAGNNLESANDCGFSASTDQINTNPSLDPNGLQNNGGPTQTIALQSGSPAIDWVASGCPSTDQRGNARPDDASESNCDIGAFESNYALADSDLGLTNVPSNITTNATSPQGAVVTYTPPTVVDEDSPLPPVNCTPASGSTFPIGTTTVTCTVTDSDDTNSPVSQSFTVTVNDTDLGLSGLPANITTNATSPQGAVVTYTPPTALDEDSPLPPVNCTPASGSTFAIGKTAVTCTVTDSDDTPSSVSQSFTVTVRPVLTVSVRNVKTSEGSSVSRIVATGKAYGTTNPLTATITWGDGTSSAGTITLNANGTYSVTGSHPYAEEGSFPLTVTVSDGGKLSVTRSGSATVSDAALKVNKLTAPISGMSVTQKGVFSDVDPNGTLTDYQATINWGDGTMSTATIATNSNGKGFTTVGTHSYAQHGTYTETLTITDAGGSTVTATIMVTV